MVAKVIECRPYLCLHEFVMLRGKVSSGRRRFMKRNRFTCTGSAAVRYPAVLAHVNDAIRKGAFGAGTIQDAVCSDVELYDLDPGISCWKLGKSRSLYQ